jgi:hypothetical protein
MRGKCLCGEVEFELSGEIPKLYQCHCSLCRKVSGSSSNAALLIAREQFAWQSGCAQIKEFVTQSGFKSHFCANCGSPLPNLTAADSAYWVPAGLLEADTGLEVVAHVFTGSRADWDILPEAAIHFTEMPVAEVMNGLLRHAKPVT